MLMRNMRGNAELSLFFYDKKEAVVVDEKSVHLST